jgi:hypothetical protein
MLRLRKLNARGVAHHAILMLLVVMAVAALGGYQVTKSKAATINNAGTSSGTSSGGTLSTSSTTQQIAALDCGSLHRSNSQVHPCGTCWAAYVDLTPDTWNDNCVKKVTCSGNNEFWQESTNTCKCTAGYVRGADGFCHVSDSGGGTPTDPGGVTPLPSCTGNHEFYQASTNSCKCDAGYVRGNDGFCHVIDTGGGTSTPTTGGGTTSPNCTGNHEFYQASTNSCKCDAGYVRGDGGFCHVISTSGTGTGTTGTGGTGTGTGTTGTGTVTNPTTQDQCDAAHRVFVNGLCSELCKSGFVKLAGGVCVARSEGGSCNGYELPTGKCVPKDKVKDYCAFHYLIYNDKNNVCQEKCIKGYFMSDGVGCKAVKVDITKPQVLDLDTSMTQKLCESLGRQWENSALDETGAKIKGCSTNACDKGNLPIVTQFAGVPYCKGYLSNITKQVCENQLHRVWSAEADGCLQNPADKDPGARIVNAPQCDNDHRVYVFKAGGDECLTKGAVDNLKGIAQATGKPFVALTNLSKAQLCNVQPHKHWNGKKCVQDKPAQESGAGGTVGNGDGQGAPEPADDGYIQCGGPVGRVKATSCPYLTDAQCLSLHRLPQAGSNPCGGCQSYFVPGQQQGVYDACVANGLENGKQAGAGSGSSSGGSTLSAGDTEITVNGRTSKNGEKLTFDLKTVTKLTINVKYGSWKLCYVSGGADKTAVNCTTLNSGTTTRSTSGQVYFIGA